MLKKKPIIPFFFFLLLLLLFFSLLNLLKLDEEEKKQAKINNISRRISYILFPVMVILKLSLPNHLNFQVNLPINHLKFQVNPPIPGASCGTRPHSSKLVPSRSSSLSMSSSHQTRLPVLLCPPANQSVAAIILGDVSDSRLYPLTKRRSEGAIPIAGNYRLIDAVVSNCINSNIDKIYALTQFNSTSLNSHLSKAYCRSGTLGKDGFVEVIAAYQSPEHHGWFQGNADAIRRCLWVLEEYPVTEFLVLPGHHLYKTDYQELIEAHRSNKADITILVSSRITNHDPSFGILKLDNSNRVLGLKGTSGSEPSNVVSVESTRQSNDESHSSFSSMGIYVINKDAMIKLLNEYFSEANDFDRDIIPGAISKEMKVQAHVFSGYWENMRSIEAYYNANMVCAKQENTGYNFYDRDSPIYTMPRCLPPTLVGDAEIAESVIGEGCILNRCKIKGSVLGMKTRVGDGAVIEDSVIMGLDTYQRDEGKSIGIPMGIGEDSVVRKAIVDKNARIGKNVMIINKESVEEGDREADGYMIRGGIIVVIRDAVIPDCSIL